jgi:phosphate transport system protein
MSQIDNPVHNLKEELGQMFQLVSTQLTKAKEALTKFDKDLAREVIQIEKRVNGQELQIDRIAENFIALYSPVAIDLRFVLAVLKSTITSNVLAILLKVFPNTLSNQTVLLTKN